MLKKKGKRKNKLVNWIKLKMIRERWLGDKKLNFAKIIWNLQQMNLAASSLGIQWVLRFSAIVQSICPIITLVKIRLKKLNLKKKKGKRQNLLVNMLSKKKLKMIRKKLKELQKSKTRAIQIGNQPCLVLKLKTPNLLTVLKKKAPHSQQQLRQKTRLKRRLWHHRLPLLQPQKLQQLVPPLQPKKLQQLPIRQATGCGVTPGQAAKIVPPLKPQNLQQLVPPLQPQNLQQLVLLL